MEDGNLYKIVIKEDKQKHLKILENLKRVDKVIKTIEVW